MQLGKIQFGQIQLGKKVWNNTVVNNCLIYLILKNMVATSLVMVATSLVMVATSLVRVEKSVGKLVGKSVTYLRTNGPSSDMGRCKRCLRI